MTYGPNPMPLVDSNALVRGQDEEFFVTITDEAGNAQDLSAMLEIAITIRKAPGAADPPLVQLVVHPSVSFAGDGLTVRAQSGQDVGVVDVLVSSTRTLSLAAGTYWYDVEVTKPDGKQKFSITPSEMALIDSVFEAA